jgi:hypothetical protein
MFSLNLITPYAIRLHVGVGVDYKLTQSSPRRQAEVSGQLHPRGNTPRRPLSSIQRRPQILSGC